MTEPPPNLGGGCFVVNPSGSPPTLCRMPLPGASLAELVGGGPGDTGQLTKPLWGVADAAA
jgi:hypothetical protein